MITDSVPDYMLRWSGDGYPKKDQHRAAIGADHGGGGGILIREVARYTPCGFSI